MIWPFRRRPQDVPARWLVVDVESSGLDPRRDRLLAIAGLALRPDGRHLVADPGDSFEVVLRQPGTAADKANILVHGIGVGAQREGVDPATALAAFAGWSAGAPLVGFHAAFDRQLIERACGAAGQPRPGGGWLDLADLAPVLVPQSRAKALDEWLDAFGIAVARRHEAAADVLATAELFQKLWPLARAQGADGSFAALQRLAVARRWVG